MSLIDNWNQSTPVERGVDEYGRSGAGSSAADRFYGNSNDDDEIMVRTQFTSRESLIASEPQFYSS